MANKSDEVRKSSEPSILFPYHTLSHSQYELSEIFMDQQKDMGGRDSYIMTSFHRKYLQGRLHVLARTDASTCGKGCLAPLFMYILYI